MSNSVTYSKLQLSLDHVPFLFPTSFGFVVYFSLDSLVFEDICLRTKLHKCITFIWIVLVMRGHVATRIRFSDLYSSPCYEDFHMPGLTIMGVQPIFGVTHISRWTNCPLFVVSMGV